MVAMSPRMIFVALLSSAVLLTTLLYLTQRNALDIPRSKLCYATVVVGNDYAKGALVLGHSLGQTGTQIKMVAIAAGVDGPHINMLIEMGFEVKQVKETAWPKEFNGTAWAKQTRGGFTKLFLWDLDQCSRVVYLDPDCMVLRNIDHLFAYSELSAWKNSKDPTRFSSGVMVLEPSAETFKELKDFLAAGKGFITKEGDATMLESSDGSILNPFFEQKKKVHSLDKTYNTMHPKSFTERSTHVYHWSRQSKPWDDTQGIPVSRPNQLWRIMWNQCCIGWEGYFELDFDPPPPK